MNPHSVARFALFPFAFVAMLGACGRTEPPATAPALAPSVELQVEALARAEAALGDFGARLRAALQARLAEEGPIGAVDFCRVQAPSIARAVADEYRLRLGRTSTRTRNPDNAPEPWQAEALAMFADHVAAGQAPERQRLVVSENLPEGVALRYLGGIRVEPPCLLCHGRTLTPVLAEALAEHYPNDAAVGYDEGELRGAFWAEVPMRPVGTP